MGYRTEWINGGRGMLRIGSGILTAGELIAAGRETHTCPDRARCLTHVVIDWTDVIDLDASFDDMQHVVVENHRTMRYAPQLVVAIIAPQQHAFDLARIWEALVQPGWTTRVFRSLTEAFSWPPLRDCLAPETGVMTASGTDALLAPELDSNAAQESFAGLERHAYRILFRENPIPAWVCEGRSLRFIDVNDAAVAHYGFSRDEFLAMTLSDISVPEDRERLSTIGETCGSAAQRIGPIRHLRQSGAPIVADVLLLPAEVDGRPLRFMLATDVSQQVLIEEQLRQAQKMEALGRLAGGIAHDFNNLLTVIRSYCELVLEGLTAHDPTRDDVATISQAAQSAAVVTRQLLAFSRKQALRPVELNVNQTIAQLEPTLRRLIGEDIRVTTALDERVGSTLVDPGQFQQVLLNLAVNARDAMPDGGEIRIATGIVQFGDGDTPLGRVITPGQYLEIVVSDTGRGMTREVQERIFEPFFSTKGPMHGTGLGLATVYGIVKQCGGYIWVKSREGKGTSFTIYLPATRADDHLASDDDARDHEARERDLDSKQNETVLVVEDDPAVRTAAVRVLRRRGYRVLEATRASEAIALARAFAENIDLVLTDLIMPEGTGVSACEALRRIRPNIVTLYMSGYTNEEIARRGLAPETIAFLQKPFTPTSLVRAVRSTLDGRLVTAHES